MAEQVQAVRAGVWRRALAFLVDSIVIILLLQIVAAVAFRVSNGHVQLGNGGVRFQDCVTLTAPPPGMAAAPFESNFINRCRSTILGFPVSHVATVGHNTPDGDTDIKMTAAVDDEGRLIKAFFLDWLFFPLLLILRWWNDRDDASPGRHSTTIHVELLSTPDSTQKFDPKDSNTARATSALAKRYALFALIWLPLTVFDAWWTLFGSAENTERDLSIMETLGGLTFIVVVVTVFIPVVRRRDTFYDRWAGTAVLRGKPKAETAAAISTPR